eukprot:scaffold5814_cov123-Isochrysis_galbana.AAC.3
MASSPPNPRHARHWTRPAAAPSPTPPVWRSVTPTSVAQICFPPRLAHSCCPPPGRSQRPPALRPHAHPQRSERFQRLADSWKGPRSRPHNRRARPAPLSSSAPPSPSAQSPPSPCRATASAPARSAAAHRGAERGTGASSCSAFEIPEGCSAFEIPEGCPAFEMPEGCPAPLPQASGVAPGGPIPRGATKPAGRRATAPVGCERGVGSEGSGRLTDSKQAALPEDRGGDGAWARAHVACGGHSGGHGVQAAPARATPCDAPTVTDAAAPIDVPDSRTSSAPPQVYNTRVSPASGATCAADVESRGGDPTTGDEATDPLSESCTSRARAVSSCATARTASSPPVAAPPAVRIAAASTTPVARQARDVACAAAAVPAASAPVPPLAAGSDGAPRCSPAGSSTHLTPAEHAQPKPPDPGSRAVAVLAAAAAAADSPVGACAAAAPPSGTASSVAPCPASQAASSARPCTSSSSVGASHTVSPARRLQ